jgi:choline dehydrogenase
MDIGEAYEYIVVGGGSAGSVIASRLSDDPDARVLLLEAGPGDLPDAAASPAAWTEMLGGAMDWADKTVAQEAALGDTVSWPRGRGLGGSSLIDRMLFVRGQRADYDSWQQDGVKGWGFDDLLPFFRRSERTQGHDPAVRGRSGPMAVASVASPHPVESAFLGAAMENGHPPAEDISSGLEEGVGWPDMTVGQRGRSTVADAYLPPVIRRRPFLDVVCGTTAHRLLMRGQRCVGVAYSRGREVLRVRCTREVIVTAGAVGSAQLLLLSGIGPADHLRDNGLDVCVDLPGVGANLHDRPTVGVTYSAVRAMPSWLGSHPTTFGLIRSRIAADVPDLQVAFTPVPYHAPGLDGPDRGYTITVAPASPLSRGSLRLAKPVPGIPPLLDPRYLCDGRDLDTLAAGLETARELGRARAFAPWRKEEILPGPGSAATREDLRFYLGINLLSGFDYAGTCRLGADDMAVVDTDLRVRGTEGLRVADASVIPAIPSAGIGATVVAIAERAAGLIQQ